MSRKPYVNALVPTVSVNRWLGRVHVGTSDADIVAELTEILDKAPADPRWTPAIREQTLRYALWKHHQNRAEYAWVMGSH